MATDTGPRETSASPPDDRRASTLAPAGVVALLVGALAALGLAPLAMPNSYSWVEYGTSESAAQGIDGAWIARTGFILYGLAVAWLVSLRTRTWGPLASALHTCFGVSMLAVAAFSTKPWQDDATYVESEDFLHSLFAGIMGSASSPASPRSSCFVDAEAPVPLYPTGSRSPSPSPFPSPWTLPSGDYSNDSCS